VSQTSADHGITIRRLQRGDARLGDAAPLAQLALRDVMLRAVRDLAFVALEQAQHVLESVDHTPGVLVSQAAEHLGVSGPTVRSWMQRGHCEPCPGRRLRRSSLRACDGSLVQ
jgi:hypothetical protein